MVENTYKQLIVDLHKYINDNKASIAGFTSCNDVEEPYTSYRGAGTYYKFSLNLIYEQINYTIHISIKDEGTTPQISVAAIPTNDIIYTQDMVDLAEMRTADNTCPYMFKILSCRVRDMGVAICKQKPIPYMEGNNKEVLLSIQAVVDACHTTFKNSFKSI